MKEFENNQNWTHQWLTKVKKYEKLIKIKKK